MLPGQAGEADLAFGAVSVFSVQPGKLRDRQFCTLTREGQETDLAVAEIEVIELA
ncbi:hypothetical protein D3C73_1181200 [compost metagenome]